MCLILSSVQLILEFHSGKLTYGLNSGNFMHLFVYCFSYDFLPLKIFCSLKEDYLLKYFVTLFASIYRIGGGGEKFFRNI